MSAPSVGLLIFFSITAAWICAKARVPGAAIFFALVALVLFIGTPVGAGLPGAIADFLNAIDGASTPTLTDKGPGAVG